MQATVLIPAAGMGRRMGAKVNKQYLELAGKPILAHTLELFEQSAQIEHIYPILPADEIDYCREQVIEKHGFSKVRKLVPGGAERQDSVRNGLLALQQDSLDQPERIILVHDGARPLFNPQLLPELLAIIAEQGACIIATPAKDTIKEVDAGLICGTPERKRLWQAQTPQGFRYQLFAEAFASADAAGFLGTDDASLLERIGKTVAILAGDYRNIKVTTPEDLVIATALLDMYREESA
ncbi:2-C-methyl-D-erythritol 4-phosphate cytidylyltransferase [Malonomonas rubra DSM 5091]|uniref:2-C-methyl-D-erythritol 4-phosphate cytidylyltransferase n=1 Tax=Malonomonas rubra DSM 5091 TaxID=1122189 RepID=A0A1M6MQX4_MALRU|nr:2-C-methyl-D-erythritol 4-phosphate cytidylyltransferase [Malonomonas rubra]SHJ85796.1 2-C-methyl-D-erythritol 4-phosphate cytidylyltransferase [Malonomonas rubra DSM 5091]